MNPSKQDIREAMSRILDRERSTHGSNLVQAAAETLGVPESVILAEVEKVQKEGQVRKGQRQASALLITGAFLLIADMLTRLAAVDFLNTPTDRGYWIGSLWVSVVVLLNILWVASLVLVIKRKV
jgi:hypothetical protein